LTVARVHPSRYIRAGDSLKLLASKSTKFYKRPKASSSSLSSRRRAVFFLHGTSTAAHCPCLQVGRSVTEGEGTAARGRAGRGHTDGGGVLVAGRLDDGGTRRRRSRLLVTAAMPYDAVAHRAVRQVGRNAEVCERRTHQNHDRRSPRDRKRQRGGRPDDDTGRQEAATVRRLGASRRSRLQQQRGVVDTASATRRSRKSRKSQRNRRDKRRRQN